MSPRSFFTYDDDYSPEALAQLPFLNHLNEKQLQFILNNADVKNYASGAFIIKEGEADKTIYFLISGQVRIQKGNVKINELRRVGDIFGEMCLVDGECRSASVIAQAETKCLCVSGEYLDAGDGESGLLYENVLYRVFSGVLVQRLRKADNEIAYLRKELDNIRR